MTVRAGGVTTGTSNKFASATETKLTRSDSGGVVSSAPANPTNAVPATQVPPATVSFG